MHEELRQSARSVPIGTDRAFGLVFALVFGIPYAWQWWHGAPEHWLIGCSATFALLALAKPVILHPLNMVWFKFGLLLHGVATPMILGVMFFAIVTPTGILMRIIGKRPLHLSKDPQASTYWIARTPPGPANESFRDQF